VDTNEVNGSLEVCLLFLCECWQVLTHGHLHTYRANWHERHPHVGTYMLGCSTARMKSGGNMPCSCCISSGINEILWFGSCVPRSVPAESDLSHAVLSP
jgi:hypothetical protein